jgi:hypothetical protein
MVQAVVGDGWKNQLFGGGAWGGGGRTLLVIWFAKQLTIYMFA